MVGGDGVADDGVADDGGDDPTPATAALSTKRPSPKALRFSKPSFWKRRLRESCYRRVREDRARLLWKIRSPADQSLTEKEFINSAFKDIISDEVKKFEDSSFSDSIGLSGSSTESDGILWEHDDFHLAYEGESEEILLEMQKIFYEDLDAEIDRREVGTCDETWEEDEDEYLACAVLEQMKLNNEQVCTKKVWCPICKHGELVESNYLVYCSLCKLKLKRDNEVTLEVVRARLGEAHTDHLNRGCRMKPMFRVETLFNITALYIHCEYCNMFEVVI